MCPFNHIGIRGHLRKGRPAAVRFRHAPKRFEELNQTLFQGAVKNAVTHAINKLQQAHLSGRPKIREDEGKDRPTIKHVRPPSTPLSTRSVFKTIVPGYPIRIHVVQQVVKQLLGHAHELQVRTVIPCLQDLVIRGVWRKQEVRANKVGPGCSLHTRVIGARDADYLYDGEQNSARQVQVGGLNKGDSHFH